MRNSRGQFLKGKSFNPKTQFKKGQHWRNRKSHWDKDWLHEKYIIEKLSVSQIAEMMECGISNIQYWLKKHDIPTRNISEVRKIVKWGLPGELNGMYGRTGESNPRWQGGISGERQIFYSSQEWKSIVPIVFGKYNYLCDKCNSPHTNKIVLHIHHLVPFKKKEIRADLDNLILLCNECHVWVHSKKNINKQYILTYEEFKKQFR